jgi:subtilisin family serine protease
MKRSFLVLAAILLGLVAFTPVGASRGKSHYIVVFKDDVDVDHGAQYLKDTYGVEVEGVYRHALKGVVVSVGEDLVDEMRQEESVYWIEKEQSYYIEAQTVPTGIQRIFADENPNISIDHTDDFRVNADVAILDTGIDFDHPDLNLYTTINCTWGGPRSGVCEGSKDDGHGHGTHVAGTVGALDNDYGVVGVAPGVRLWGVKVLTNWGYGTTTTIVAGIDYVAEHADEIEVANMSLGGVGESQVMDLAISNAVGMGVTFVLSAGNAAIDVDNYHPAGNPDAITVSALADFDGKPGGSAEPTCRDDVDDTLIYFSNFGGGVDVTAPGTCIYSTYREGAYATMSGTSMAAPHVAGAAAILASSGAGSPAVIKSIVLASGNYDWVDDSGDGIQEPLLDLSDTGVFIPDLLSVSSGITLEGTAYRVAGVQHTDLTWTGANGDEIDVYRDGALVDTVTNDGFHTDVIGEVGAGYHGYLICESGSINQCSQPIYLYY